MIPYFSPPNLQLGPLSINPFGILVAVGILLAARLCGKEAERRGLSAQVLADFAFWGVLAGVVSGHLVHLFFYHPEELAKSPLQVLKVWDGLSSMGGLLGGIIAAFVFFRRKGVPFAPYGDPLALGVSMGWGIARLGCFAVHDHPGRLTDFPLAVAGWPGGGIRHDLGLYDALVLFACFGLLMLLNRRGLLKDRLLPLLAVLYGTARFFLDFLRATDLSYVDARYLGLTPAQFVVMALVLWGVVQLVRAPRVQTPPLPAGARTQARAS
ncbi:MAG: prolipoprotein diacylglyceryl transferase [Myxococcaceae bacterium]|nr:prolipoprotein diacylglyceryl transferase [Myxococcaceae bacterium]